MNNTEENKIKEKTINSEYMIWLENFTEKINSFSDDGWHYFSDKYPEQYKDKILTEDKEKINNLKNFYEFINTYFKSNYVYPICNGKRKYFCIKFNDNGYEIGCVETNIFFCKRVAINDKFIDFIDIMEDKKQATTFIKKKQLKDLSSLIEKLLKNNIPLEAIYDVTEETIQKVYIKL